MIWVTYWEDRKHCVMIQPKYVVAINSNTKMQLLWKTKTLLHIRENISVSFSHPTTFIDMLVLYAGIRSARGKPESLKLQAVAQKELKDEKLDYSEAGNIRTAAYEDFRKFALYSFKRFFAFVCFASENE